MNVEIRVIQVAQVGPDQTTILCPKCKVEVRTETRTEAGLLAWGSCVAMCAFG
jgi:LITAF-like zinc ribbon domain